MIKSFLLIVFLAAGVWTQDITPYYVLPVQTTQNVLTTYSFLFGTDTAIASNAQVSIAFPFEFDPTALTHATKVRYLINGTQLQNAIWTLNNRTFTIQTGSIAIGNITVVIDGVLNPKDYTTSSYFTVQTLFKNVVVTSNSVFARVPFTPAPTTTAGGTVNNYVNTYIEQGSSWTFNFTLAGTYSTNSSVRFIFPQDFLSNKIQCNVSGVVDPNMKTRVFPSQNVYDCLNLQQPLSGTLGIVLSGVVNPNYQMTASGFQVHILQPNNMIVSEIITSVSTVAINTKPLNTTLTIPNNYRNTSGTYIFQINPDTNLQAGDYMVFTFTGIWNLFTNATNIISGVLSSTTNTPTWTSLVNTTGSKTTLTLTNFTSIPKTTQFTFYQPLVTPITPSTYSLTIKSYRFNGGLAQSYSQNIVINQTTGYIRQMKLHPMQRAIKLPVGMTGPLQIVLFLQNNLPQTNVLTYGKIVIQITPNIPAPIVSLNGVPKCYFYMNIPAANCTFDSSDPTMTVVTIFTPVNFNFQQSQVPLTITTEGYQQPNNQGITIDTLVKRYFFEIQFYSNLRPPPIPLEVIFDEWIPDSIPLNTLSCATMTLNQYEYEHLKCTFTTPNQILNSNGHIHFFRIEFSESINNYGWNVPTSSTTPDYPCLMYGTNVSANPYVRCDYVTWKSGPYKSQQSSACYSYITFYGLSTIPGGSTITFEIPKIQRQYNGWDTSISFSILEDTPGYSSPIVYLYTQKVSFGTNYGTVGGYNYQNPSKTLTNNVINKVTNITLNNYPLGTTGITQIIFEVDQTAFPNIGRANNIACGSHICSKFDYPIQYFILYPSSSLGSSATLTFPSIATPPYSGSFAFYTRTYVSSSTQTKSYFYVDIVADTITDCSYNFSPLETVTTLYPNSNHFYVISWAVVNPVLSLSGNSYILITINNIFTLSSTYCTLSTTASAYDGRGIFCQLSTGGTQINLKNLKDIPAGASFNLTVQMQSTDTTSTVSPTVNIQTYYGNGALVDQALNVHFTTYPLSNTNLTVFSTFTVPQAFTSVRAITAGYYGNLLVTFTPQDSGSVINGSTIILTMATGFYPSGNVLGLPLSCILNNNNRFSCTYTLNPFTITIVGTNGSFTTSNNILNITTLYQTTNGVTYPGAGRYLLQLQIKNSSTSQSLEKVQQYIDILPGDVAYFNVTWAHRDIGQVNIYTVEFKNGPTAIPSYNDATNAGRIYIGFPMRDSAGNTVFTPNLGYSGIGQGNVLPCYFDTGSNFVTATVGKSLTCKIRMSMLDNLYNTWIEVVNFASIPAGSVLRVIIGKITNPSLKQIDINFLLKVKTLTVSSNIETQLYQTSYNMFFDMLTASITSRSEVNASSVMFQPGSTIGQSNRYFNITPYTGFTFNPNDWFIINLDPQFPLSGSIYNCLSPFYQYCIIYPTINWLAVKIGNGTILPLQPFISQLPISISRVDTTYLSYTFLSGRWSETITYTVTALSRWLQIRGAVSGFTIQVLGSQNKINVGQQSTEILVSFNVSHNIPVGGTIQLQFPNNSTTVPAIKPHCRSAVTLGSALNGYNTGKPSVNVEGEIGCLVQNTYSWIITGFDVLAAGSQVKIYGLIDFPTTAVNSLGMGYVATYSNQDVTSAFLNAKTIDYLSTNFPFPVQNLTWNVDTSMAMLKAQPLRIGYVGPLTFILKLASSLNSYTNGGYIRVNLWYYNTVGNGGGFNGPSSNLVCTIFDPATGYKYGCFASCYQPPGSYTGFQIQSYQNLPTSTDLQITLTTQKGSATEGINYPTATGTFKAEIEVQYYTSSPYNKNQAYYIDVYGPDFNILYFNSTVTIPAENNFIMVIFTPSSTIATNQQLIIEIPTVSIDGQNQFPIDLGVGYKNYDDLEFDIFESGITSMTCKVFTGDLTSSQPVKIVCSNFNIAITTAMSVKFGFWVVNPASSVSMAIPVQVYAFDQPSQTKFCWSIVEAGIRVLPITVTPINDLANWQSSSTYREIMSTSLSFTTRNTKAMVQYDWYILKFNFDLRNTADSNGSLTYNTNLAGTGDVIFLRNCQTILLRIGSTAVSILTSGLTTINAKINSLFYNPSYQLTTSQASVLGYIIYNSADACEKVIYSDLFLSSLVPNEPSSPTFTINPVYTNKQMGQFDDYRFTFTMSSSAGNSTSLVKLISIQFPPSSTYDIGIMGTECYEYSSSSIEVSSCLLDAVNRVIWITPVIKSIYTNNNPVIVETANLAIQNPVNNVTINFNQFTIRYYTWPDGQDQPNIAAGSDNWCFMKQDSSLIPSNTISFNTFSTTYYSPHTYLSVPKQIVVNEWQPADYYVNNASTPKLAKSPFRFKLIAPATFSSLSGSNQHTISLYFGSYYSNPTLNQHSNDLYYYVPACELNGRRVHACSISSGNITMSFQNSIANAAEISVKFSVINPYDETDEGFTLTTTTDGTIVLPIYITPYGGTTYYVEETPFHPFYRATSAGATYPSMGISNIALNWGTQAQGQLNYLEFVITLTRSDINGFVIEIPVVSEDGTVIYNNPTLMGLPSGSKYPCSMGVYTSVYCTYITGVSTNYGTPTRIYVSDFSVPSNNSISFRMLFTNPDIQDVFPKFTFKAFGGTYSAPNMMGDQLKGLYTIVDPYMIYSSNNYYSTATMPCYPTKILWQTQGYYECYTDDQVQPVNTYAILRWPLVDAVYGNIGDYDSAGGPYDHFFMSSQGTNVINQMFVYIVIKLSSQFTPSWNGLGWITSKYTFGYIRMKHHILNSYYVYLLAKDWTKRYTVSVDSSWVQTNLANNGFGQFTVDVIDLQSRYCNDWSWHFLSINTGTAHTTSYSGKEPSEAVIEITIYGGSAFNALSSSYTTCNIDSGVIGHDPLNPVTCVVDVTNSKFVIYNVYSLTSTQLRIFYYARAICTNQGSFQATVTAYANVQAYNDHNWYLFRSTTNNPWTLNWMFISSASFGSQVTSEPAYNYVAPTDDIYSTYQNIFTSGVDGGGYAQITYVSSTQVTFALNLAAQYDLKSYTYRLGFWFYAERLQANGQVCNSVTVSTSRYSSIIQGGWTGKCEAGDRQFFVDWRMYVDSSTYQNQWPVWVAGDTWFFTFTFNGGITQDSTNYANQIFAHATIVNEQSTYYFNDNGHCGCCVARACNCVINSTCCGYNCGTSCCTGCDCRWILGWGYIALTNKNVGGWSQAPNPIAQYSNIYLLSNQYGVETEFSFYLQNLYGSLTSTMLSTTATTASSGSSAQLVISFSGDSIVFSAGNPFPYATTSESAAYVECLCVVSSSTITISAGTSYTAANCTRYIPTGYPPFLTVRVTASVGQYLSCYFPGFKNPTSSNNGLLTANFYRDTMNHFKFYGLPDQFRSNYQTVGVNYVLGSNSYGLNTVTYNSTFWTTYGSVNQNKYYQLYVIAPSSRYQPYLYLSSYSPKTSQSTCNSGSYLVCRAYNSFFSRRYFLVVQYNNWASTFNLTDNLDFPQSQQALSSYYSTYIGFTYGGLGYYYSLWSGSLNAGYFSPASPAFGLATATYSTNLQSTRSLMSVSIQLNGYTLYSNRRTQGPFKGSFAQLNLGGFSSLNGCGVVAYNNPSPSWSNNALYCIIQSNTQINIYSNADWSFTGQLYITFETDSVPSSSTYTFYLYDRYTSGSDNGLAVSTSGTFGRTVSGSYTTLQPTSINWRRQTYKDVRSDAGPVKLTLNNNYQYVSTYSISSNAEASSSDAIVINVPGSGLSNDAYYCYAREYLPNQYSTYKEYVVNCIYSTGTKILIKSISSHILNPAYYYELIIYKNMGSGSSLIIIPSASTYIMQVGTINAYSGGSWQYYDWIPVNNYLNVYPITLSSIYILTRQAAAINSLYISFSIGVAESSSNIYYLEFVFDSLDLNYFNIQSGGSIPCVLSGTFSTYPGKQNPPRCFGYADGLNNTTPLIIRVYNFAGYTAGTSFQIAFDNFNNPPLNTLILVPINLRVNLVDRTNNKVYTSYFPNVYYSDSVNVGVPSNLGGSITMGDSHRGYSTYHYTNLNWPYNSDSTDISQKIVLKILGGITCSQSIANLYLSDSQTGYTKLWYNSVTNTSVYITPSKGVNTNTNWFINGVINPNQVNYQTYNKIMQVTITMYSSYKTSYFTTLNQPSFSSYSILTDFTVSGNPTSTEGTANFKFHSDFPMTYEFSWSPNANSYGSRNISYIILYFTSGVKWLDCAWFRYPPSPYFTNQVGNAKVGYDASANQWYVNITGVQDSYVSTSYDWSVRVRLYASGNGNYIYYTSYVYNFNGNLEFASTSGNRYLPSDNWSSSGNIGKPTTWNIEFERYTKGYFELSKNVIYAATSQTTNKLFYKFTPPYNMSQVESLSFASSSTNYPAPATPNNGLYCIIQPTVYQISIYGAGLYAPCTYSSGTYSVTIPTGGMIIKQYLLTVIDRRQLTTTFNMPPTPQRIQVSIIYNSMLNLQYGDVYTLDFPGMMTSYTMSHASLMSGQLDMLGFTFTPAFTLPAASTSAPVTESVLSFEVESNYYHSCLNIAANVFNADGMPFYSGVYYSHYSNPAVPNSNTRILCGQNTQSQDWAPIRLTVTDYGAVTAGTIYYFRFPLITLPSGSNVPLTYKVKLLQYSNGNAYPNIMNQFSFENKYSVTSSGISTSNEWAYLSYSNNIVQNNMNFNFYYNSAYFNIYNSGYETLVKFDNNGIPALTSLSTLTNLGTGQYGYQYYPNINLCSFIKLTTDNSYGFSLGTFSTSIDQQTFQLSYVYTYTSQSALIKGYFNSGVNNALSTISYASSWTTATFNKGTNLLTDNSEDLYTVSWSANYLSFPEGSYMMLTFSTNFTLIDEYCNSYSGFLQGTNANSNLVCKRFSSTQIKISGYATLASSASLSITLYLQIADIPIDTLSHSVNIIVYSSQNNIIINANTNTLTFTLVEDGSLALGLFGTMTNSYASGSSFPLYITFKLNTHTLTNGDYLQVDFGSWVLDPATTGVQAFKYQLSGTNYWVPSQATLVSGNIYKIPVYSNYSMNAGTQTTLWVDTFAPTTYYGAKSNSIQWNSFKIYAYHSATLVQQQVTRIWTEPFSHASFAVAPALNYVGVSTLWQFSVTPNVSASAGDTILMEFQTHDMLNSLFSNNLGATIPSGNSGSFDCSEYYNTHVISSPIIQCRVYAGDNTKTPSIPTTIAIPITLNIPANTLIKYNIFKILNPSISGYPMSVVFKLATPCSSQDSNNLCSYYKSVVYMTFNANPGIPGYGYGGSLTFNPSLVSANNTQHTISCGYGLLSNDFVVLSYYSQIPIPSVCSLTSTTGVCYSYSTTNTIIIKVNTTISNPFSLILAGMSNPYQNFYGSYTFYTEIWRSGSVYVRYYTDYTATTITSDPTTGNPLIISFIPTLTPNYELKYGFENIANVTLTNMIQNAKVKQIRITAPGEITIDTQYCNATMQTFAGEAIPYPYRFSCETMGSNYIILNLFSNFPAWTNAITQRSIYIYIRYTILNSKTVQSNDWYAYAYTDPSSSSSIYAVSYATGHFPIVEYQLPFLYVINFPTRSFSQRTCTLGQQCMIYGFIYPTTPSATMVIDHMTFLLPKEFNYSSLQTFDSCFIQSTTTTYYSFNCPLTRNNSQITIGFNPTVYNQLYNLFNIDTSNTAMLFTAPKYPGNHYQMQVNLWSSSNALVESQYINLTTVYGYYLSVPLINFIIPLDASQMGLYDVTFTTGTADILPSYINSATYTITSAIQISFANTFDAALGTGLSAGSQIACLSLTGLTFNIMKKITCKIYPSVSTITYPTIIVTGYDRIYAGTVIRIQFANLKTLPATITDYCTLGVSYSYYAYGGVKGYIYQPVSFVVGPTTAQNTLKAITYTISQVSTNYVGQLSNYTLAGSIGTGFSPITTSDYFVVQFPPFIFEGRFNLNPQALCSLAASNKCYVFGLANQVYIQPSSSVSTASFSFTINKLLNAAYEIEYLIENITLFTLVGHKVNALGFATFTKFTQASLNVSSIITSIDSIYGGDSGINYYFSFQLNSYLPETGKVSIFFPSIYISLFTVNSKCFLRQDSQLAIGGQAYCQIINNYQLVIIPNGVLLSGSQPYYVTVTNITNPNMDLSTYRFKIQTYYSSNVYSPSVISRTYFSSPTLSLITVKNCQLQISASIYNQNLPSQYQINLICPATIKQSSELKLYLSWNPSPTNLTCSSSSNNLYSTQCNILTEYSQTTKLTYLSIYLRSIQAEKLVSITATITNGIQGTYIINSTINYNGFVYLQAASNSYYVTGSPSASSSATTLTVKSGNYPLNRYYSSIYTFALTNPKMVVSTLQIDIPSIVTQSKQGVNCGYQSWNSNDDYFNLMMKDGTNVLNCNMTGQKLQVSGLAPLLGNLTTSGFLYLTVNGLINPSTSVSQSNFTFTLINTTSTIYQAVGIYTLPLSYSVSNPPINIQISSIVLSDSRYFVNSLYTFSLTSVQSAIITIVNNSNMGIVIRFPQQYSDIWQQIATPSVLNLTINSVTYPAANITMKSQYLFARFPLNTFTGQLTFTSASISFNFRNPNKSIDCTISPVFQISMFDFLSNSIFTQTLSNNQICPSLSNRLYAINVTGNTKISAGSSTTFIVSIQKPASYLAITPSCTSSAISFTPSVVTFQNFTSTTQNFTISAAIGLSGNYNVTFSKQESNQTYYNDIQFTTLNIYVPTSKYKITMDTFSTKSTGLPISTTFKLDVPSPTDFALTFAHNCNSNFSFSPSSRISIPAQSSSVNFYVQYNGKTVPSACQLNFSISALTSNNFVLANPIVYLSGKTSIDKSSNTPPLILELTTTPQNSTNVGAIVVSNLTTGSSSSSKYYSANAPTLYTLNVSGTGANHADLMATTSTNGTIYYAILSSGTPTGNITQSAIYSKNLSNAIAFGNSNATLNTSGVNTISSFTVKALIAQTNYIIAAYLNSTVGISTTVYQNFSTSNASNGASITLAMSTPVNVTTLLSALSNVWRIQLSRIGLLTSNQTLNTLQSSFSSSVMNNRSYVYEVVVAPDTTDDSITPLDLLNSFIASRSEISMLLQLIPQYVTTYKSQTRPITPTKPSVRAAPIILSASHEQISVHIKFWQQAYVYGVIILNPTNKTLSTQVINGQDANNKAVVSQHYVATATNGSGQAILNFTLLNDNSSYTIFVSAECVLPFTPRLRLADTEVMQVSAHTKVNLNLMKNQEDAVHVISEYSPELAAKVKIHLDQVNAATTVEGSSKNTKRRTHK